MNKTKTILGLYRHIVVSKEGAYTVNQIDPLDAFCFRSTTNINNLVDFIDRIGLNKNDFLNTINDLNSYDVLRPSLTVSINKTLNHYISTNLSDISTIEF